MELPLTIVVLLPHVSSMTSLVMHIFLTLFLVRQSSSHLVTIPPPYSSTDNPWFHRWFDLYFNVWCWSFQVWHSVHWGSLCFVDWHERRRTVSAGNCLASINTNTCTTLSADARHSSSNPSHYSYLAGRFWLLWAQTCPPRTIKGIRGLSISATGIGNIRFRIAKGLEITLEPVLFVPEVSVCLISIFILGSGPQKLISHFNGDGCWLTNSSVLPSPLARCPWWETLYTLNMGSSLIEHLFIATRVPDIKTWHCCLEHVNYKSIVDMSNNGMVRGMHVNLSSAPPKCQSCILGKQTRMPVPKYKKECRLQEYWTLICTLPL